MFYAPTAALLFRGQEYSKHQGVAGAFGKEFARTGQLRPDLHRYLLDALDDRHEADYGEAAQFTTEQAGEEIGRAEEFLAEVESYLASHPDEKTDN